MPFQRFARFFDGLSRCLNAIMQPFGNRIPHCFDMPVQRFEGAFMIRFGLGEESTQSALLFTHWYNGMGS